MKNFIDWTNFTPAFAATELPRQLEAAERGVCALEASAPDRFESLVWALDDATRGLFEAWGKVQHLLSVMNSAEWRKVEEDFRPQLVTFALRVAQSRPLYEASKRALANETDPVRRRILEKSIEASDLEGVGLEGEAKARFNGIQRRLAQLQNDFANAVIDATKAFSFEKGGKTYAIDDANYVETMKHCADREVRERLYRARSTRAPENEARLVEILALRRELAALLGFGTYADLSLKRKCASSVAAALAMIDDLDAKTVGGAAREERELGEGLEPWDRAYAAERLRERKYEYSEEELKRHFELSAVLNGLFTMSRFLFGVEIREVAEKPPVWHPDVRFFAVLEDGREIAHFYLDPYVRTGLKQGGAWMNEFRNRSDRRGETPVAVLVLNNLLPDAEGKSLMPLREVETVFHEFGHALQCMLTKIGEEGAAGINLVEWDAVEVASQFMENWCLDDRTGIVLPAELKAKVRSAKNFRAASACRRQLAFAKLDLLLHSRDPQLSPPDSRPSALQAEIFTHFGLPFLPDDRFLCAFTHIFAGGYAAGYYGYKWAEVMSADCYGAFEEADLKDDAVVAALGRRYRETILALGGSKSALDVFRAFRGRDPDSTALLRQQDLIDTQK